MFLFSLESHLYGFPHSQPSDTTRITRYGYDRRTKPVIIIKENEFLIDGYYMHSAGLKQDF